MQKEKWFQEYAPPEEAEGMLMEVLLSIGYSHGATETALYIKWYEVITLS